MNFIEPLAHLAFLVGSHYQLTIHTSSFPLDATRFHVLLCIQFGHTLNSRRLYLYHLRDVTSRTSLFVTQIARICCVSLIFLLVLFGLYYYFVCVVVDDYISKVYKCPCYYVR